MKLLMKYLPVKIRFEGSDLSRNLSESTSKHRIITVAFLVFLFYSLKYVQAQCETVHYVGNDIWVYSLDNIQVTAWFRPLGVDWEAWKVSCFAGNEENYYRGLINRIVAMFDLRRALLVTRGLDESRQRVYLTLSFSVTDSGFYNAEMDSLMFRDIFKLNQAGYLDEVHVYFQIPFYDVSPTPTLRMANEVHWINRNFAEAPSYYTIQFSGFVTFRVEAVGLPEGVRTRVYLDNELKGYVSSASPLEIKVKISPRPLFAVGGPGGGGGQPRYYTISVDPEVALNPGVKYVASKNSYDVSGSATLTFRYTKMIKVILDNSITINGSHYSSGEYWIPAGFYTLYAEMPTRTLSPWERSTYVAERWVIAGHTFWGNPTNVRIDSDRDPVRISVSFIEVREYYVRLTGGLRDVSGWFKENSIVEAEVEGVRQERSDIRYVFVGWYEGGSLYSDSIKLSIRVSRPINLEARWRKEYLVYIDDPYDVAEGGGWYPEGSEAHLRVPREVVQQTSDTAMVFNGWVGDVSASSSSVYVRVDSPKRIKVSWVKAYRVAFDPGRDVEYFIHGCKHWHGGYCWAEEGSIIRVQLKETRRGLLVTDVLDHFSATGMRWFNQDPSRGYLEGSVSEPVYIKAYWKSEYAGLLFLVVAVTMVGIVSVIYLKRFQNPLQKELNKYENALKKLEELRRSGRVSYESYIKLRDEYESKIKSIKEREKLKAPSKY